MFEQLNMMQVEAILERAKKLAEADRVANDGGYPNVCDPRQDEFAIVPKGLDAGVRRRHHLPKDFLALPYRLQIS